MTPENEREIDARVAENIFNLPTQCVKRREGYLIPEDYYLVQERPSVGGKDFRKLPAYSTDLTDAWTVIDRMILDRWSFRLSCAPEEGGRWQAFFAGHGDLESSASDINFTLAICLAALKAVDVRRANDAPQAAHDLLAEAPL